MILDETIALLKQNYTHRISNLCIDDVRIGLHLTAVKLSDASHGVAGTITENQHFCDKHIRDFNAFTPKQIIGRPVLELFDNPKKSNITDTLQMAVLNAISAQILASGKYNILTNTDPYDLVSLNKEKTITIVGAFHSYIKKSIDKVKQLFVLEMNKNALSDEHKPFYVPATEYKAVLPISDVVFITGLSLVNNTIDGLLEAISPEAVVIVTGPSSSLVPEILFRHNVKMIGATRITNPEIMFDVVSQAGTGYHLFHYCAEKICIVNERL